MKAIDIPEGVEDHSKDKKPKAASKKPAQPKKAAQPKAKGKASAKEKAKPKGKAKAKQQSKEEVEPAAATASDNPLRYQLGTVDVNGGHLAAVNDAISKILHAFPGRKSELSLSDIVKLYNDLARHREGAGPHDH